MKTSDTRKQYLGTDKKQNVFTAELSAVKQAVRMINEEEKEYEETVVYANS
jgi:hypothetical protein